MSEPKEIVSLLKSLEALNDITEFRQALTAGLKIICPGRTLLDFGSCLLDRFIQLNWTGPREEHDQLLTALSENLKTRWDDSCLKDEYDGETWYELVKCPHLLSLANSILVEEMIEDYNSLLWALRCLSIQHQLLSVKSITVWNHIQSIIEKLLRVMDDGQVNQDDLCSTHLEISNCFLSHSQYDQALKHLSLAQKFAGISLELSGALGRRTKFQQFDTAQLLLKVSQNNNDGDSLGSKEATTGSTLPRDVLLEDDTILDTIKFIEPGLTTDLSLLQQAVVLNQCIHYKWTSPMHRLTTEQLQAYLETILSQPKCWAIQTMALYMRSLLERTRSRAMERSMMQLQELVDLYSNSLPEVDQRMILFYCIPLPPRWIIEKEFADTLVKLGANQSALDVFERLHLWDDVISCYQAVGRHGQAESVIRERMAEEGESVKLWCLLGDASKDHTCYQKAWELSKHKNARSMKSLGLYYLSKDKFEECADSLQKSVNINPLQVGLWFTLGHAANKIEDHTLAAHAYRQCVTMESDNFEAWNNLAGEYIKLKDKLRAFNAFQEALKCNYENWKIWDNYLVVSTDIGEFEESIRAYHRLLDIQRKHLDTEVLGYVTDAVINEVIMRNGHKASELRKKLGELLARIVAQTTGNTALWEICSILHLSSSDAIDISKGLIELQKAQRTARQPPGWETDGTRTERVYMLTMKYSKAYRDNVLQVEQMDQILASARLCIQGVVTKLKDATGIISDDNRIKYEEMIQTLSDELTTMK